MSVGRKSGKAGSSETSAATGNEPAPSIKPSSLAAGRADATRQIHRSLKAWRDQEDPVEASKEASPVEDREHRDDQGDKEQIQRSVSTGGDKVFLADDPTKLTGGGRKKLGNLQGMAAMTVRAAIKERGGGASQANMCGQWADKTVAETANAAAAGDALAETAIKMIKQASAKAGDHSGRSG